jgi:acyl dehydratase
MSVEPIFQALNVGDEVVNLVKEPVTKNQLVRYAGASGDFNPLHTDDESARAVGFDGVIAHGMLVMGFLTQAVTTWIPRRLFRKIKVRFKGVTLPGDVLTMTARVAEKRIEGSSGIVTCSIEAMDQDKDVKVAGTFEAVFPLQR